MARPGLDKNPKFRRLVRQLGLPRPYVRGLLETLWECAYENGDAVIGDSAAIEAAAEWPGEDGVLTDALLDAGGGRAGFIEPVEGQPDRYQIHDLWDHAPDYVRRRRSRELERRSRGEQLAKSAVSDRSPSATDRSLTSQRPTNGATPAPAPAPAPNTSCATGSAAPAGSHDARFVEFWEIFPPGRKKNRKAAYERWRSAIKRAPPEAIIAAASEYASSDEGRGEFVKMPETWLNKECWNDERGAWKNRNGNAKPLPTGPSKRFVG